MDEREKVERDEHARKHKEGERVFNAFVNGVTSAGLVLFALVIVAALVVTGIWSIMEYWQWLNR